MVRSNTGSPQLPRDLITCVNCGQRQMMLIKTLLGSTSAGALEEERAWLIAIRRDVSGGIPTEDEILD